MSGKCLLKEKELESKKAIQIFTREELKVAQKVKGQVQPSVTLDIIERNLDMEVSFFDFFDIISKYQSSLML